MLQTLKIKIQLTDFIRHVGHYKFERSTHRRSILARVEWESALLAQGEEGWTKRVCPYVKKLLSIIFTAA
jgi:hypothetical protein